MNLFWLLVLPGTIVAAGLFAARWVVTLKFFSSKPRSLEWVDIPNDVREIRIDQWEALVGDEGDWIFKNAWEITRWERRRAVNRRHAEIRRRLYFVISNCILFREVARFHVEEAALENNEEAANSEQSDRPFRVIDRAVTVQLMAVICLGKLRLLDCCRLVYPFYVPQLSDHFQVRGNDMIAWYRHLMREMLDLTKHYYDDVVYTRFFYQLTGALTEEEATELNRL